MLQIDNAAFQQRADRLAELVTESDRIFNMIQPALVSCEPEVPAITMSFPAQHWEQNLTGAVHGGIVATMLDTVMGTLTYAITGGFTPTVSMNITYTRPAPGDGTLLARARASMAGQTVICIEAEMWDSRTPEKFVATAQGIFRNLPEAP